MKPILNLVRKCTDGQRTRYLLCLALGVLIQAIALIQPQLSGHLIDFAAADKELIPTVAAITALLSLNGIFSISQQISIGRAAEDVAKNIRKKLAENIFSLSILDYESRSPGWYSQRLLSDVDLIKNFPGRLIQIIQSSLMLIGSLIALIVIDWWTFSLGFILGAFALCFTALASKPVKKQIDGVQDLLSTITTKLQNFSFAGRLLNSYNAWTLACNKITEYINMLHKLGIKRVKTVSFFSPISSMLMQVASMSVIVLGAFRVSEGMLSFSNLIVFLMYFSFFSSAINQIASSIQQIRAAEVGNSRIDECLTRASTFLKASHLSQHEPPLDSKMKSTEPMSIHFKNVSYSYPGNQTPVLKNVSFSIPSGIITALVGQSGGGKSTCFGLIERFFDSYDGIIAVDNVNVRNLEISKIRDDIAYIDQDSTAMRGSLRSNLSLANSKTSDEDMQNALRAVGMDAYSDQLDYDVGEQGLSLSGGQRQRLSLARAIIKKPRLLLMDEPTANLDGISEKDFFNLLTHSFPNTTILYSAHRASMIVRADWVIVIKDGKLVGEGLHDTLMKQCLHYRELITSQYRQDCLCSN